MACSLVRKIDYFYYLSSLFSCIEDILHNIANKQNCNSVYIIRRYLRVLPLEVYKFGRKFNFISIENGRNKLCLLKHVNYSCLCLC